jgi:hypothetical protein
LHNKFVNFECHSISVNIRYCPLGKFFTLFHSQFQMPIYMKVMSLNKLDNSSALRLRRVSVRPQSGPWLTSAAYTVLARPYMCRKCGHDDVGRRLSIEGIQNKIS